MALIFLKILLTLFFFKPCSLEQFKESNAGNIVISKVGNGQKLADSQPEVFNMLASSCNRDFCLFEPSRFMKSKSC